MHNNYSLNSGFTLVEMLIAITVFSILALIAYPTYSNYVRDARIAEVQGALIENAHFMEKFYLQHHSFKRNSTTWPTLPITANNHFCIKPQGNARGANTDRFTLKAVAFNKSAEPRVIKINEAQQIIICESSKSTCDDNDNFFSGANSTDKQCRMVY
ncbi:type IV pilin protein [Neisseria wadsworthii]|uniref:Pilin n=1 Tax=Neisseria wadsworthii 9715 TaxID=1030841 RepID=G4CPW6_9NEIS|nr:type IV pilin protein [Neisseria wadsworthii]EGZ47281.1 hypothetical protein HMPREF9370_1126 [Neisseria wadsworthii 9715]QMT34905.1 type IV pilin protein [Neisseria wadsworthii]